MVLSVSSPVQSQVVAPLLEQIAAELSQEQNLVRIKKLLLYVCTGTWENDRHRLARAPLDALLQHLFESCSTFEQLQQQLNQVVASLNKSAEYTIVANAVISRLHPVYAQLEQDQPTANQAFYAAIARSLQQDPELIRIKKLLLLACRSTWENNSAKLAQLNMLSLVQELHQIAPTVESVHASLTQIAKVLSKPDEYNKVAEIISNAFQSAEPVEIAETTEPLTEPTAWMPVTEFIRPNILSNKKPDQISEAANASQRNQKHTELKASTTEIAVPPIPIYIPKGVHDNVAKSVQKNVSKPITQLTPKPSPQVSEAIISKVLVLQPQKNLDLFDLRLQIMQDTNPLRAKILLFSLLHELFQGSAEHEAFLKNHELDDLLRVFFLSYKLYSEAEDQLRKVAKQLAANHYLQVAEAIIRAIQPFYTAVESAVNLSVVPALPAEITNMKAATNEITLPE